MWVYLRVMWKKMCIWSILNKINSIFRFVFHSPLYLCGKCSKNWKLKFTVFFILSILNKGHSLVIFVYKHVYWKHNLSSCSFINTRIRYRFTKKKYLNIFSPRVRNWILLWWQWDTVSLTPLKGLCHCVGGIVLTGHLPHCMGDILLQVACFHCVGGIVLIVTRVHHCPWSVERVTSFLRPPPWVVLFCPLWALYVVFLALLAALKFL